MFLKVLGFLAGNFLPNVKNVVIASVRTETPTGSTETSPVAIVTEKPWFLSKSFIGLGALAVYALAAFIWGWEVDATVIANILNNSGDIFVLGSTILAGIGRARAITTETR